MRHLILSDIHSNGDALRAVLAHAAGAYDDILCCGDLVGYGAEPNESVAWAREHAAAVVRGNHDKACTGSPEIEWFNAAARVSALWTMDTLTADNRDYVRQLPPGPLPVDGLHLIHGSPLDEDEYLISAADVAQAAPYLPGTVHFFGHTHVQGGFLCHRNGVRPFPGADLREAERIVQLEPDTAYLLNPGSVGQPRDHDPRAAYVLYEVQSRLLSFRRVPYDVEAAQKRIRDAGLPEVLAYRLELGQ